MKAHKKRIRRLFVLEDLEGRVALSTVGVPGQGLHHRLGHPAEIHVMKHGHDDPAGHDAHHQHRGGTTAAHGASDPVGHDANDDHGGAQSSAPGLDDPSNHDASEATGDHNNGGQGSDDPVSHDANDDHGGHGGNDRGGHH